MFINSSLVAVDGTIGYSLGLVARLVRKPVKATSHSECPSTVRYFPRSLLTTLRGLGGILPDLNSLRSNMSLAAQLSHVDLIWVLHYSVGSR